MEHYPAYKDSGFEWIGEIPSHWELRRLATLGNFSKGRGISRSEIRNEGLPCIRYGEIYTIYDRVVHRPVSFISVESSISSERIEKGDVLFTGSGETLEEIGKSVVYTGEEDIYAGGDLIILKLRTDISPPFTSFLLNSHIVNQQKTRDGKGGIIVHIYPTQLREIKLTLPPLLEQEAIASFLDRKTKLIDDLIAKKRRLIELKKEERTAIINQAVTKGLDPNVPMKDSGIEWLGEIPEHWKVKKLKYVSNIVLGKMLTPADKGGYQLKPYLRAQNLNWLKINANDIKEMWFSGTELKHYRIRKYDLLVSEGGEVGRTSIWNNEIDECYIQNSVHKVTITGNNNPYYFLYFFVVSGGRGYFDAAVNRVSIAHLTREKLKEIIVFVPPIHIQQLIVEFITAFEASHNFLIDQLLRQIDLLKEYKTTLISEAVTGKIKIR
ncbi:MAG: restriction endonuclease subunit S [Bacteroidota bacterium]